MLRHTPILSFVLLILLLTGLSGCGVQQRLVRGAMAPVIEGGFDAMMAETDLEIAHAAVAANLKLIEGIALSDPGYDRAKLLAAQAAVAYAMAYVEHVDVARARALYLRGRGHAMEWLERETGTDLLAIGRFADFEAAVAELDEEAVPGLFWAANAWASALMLSLDDINAIAMLPRVELMMARVLELEPGYWHNGARLFYGAYYGARPPMLGGNPAKAREQLELQIERTDGQMLLGQLFLARYVHLPALDEEATRSTLEAILAVTLEDTPAEMRLINRISQEKARRLLEGLDERF